jgi:hypothetical protein
MRRTAEQIHNAAMLSPSSYCTDLAALCALVRSMHFVPGLPPFIINARVGAGAIQLGGATATEARPHGRSNTIGDQFTKCMPINMALPT